MNIASEQTHSSLVQRIAKVRNCMLVELSTDVSPTDKDLFASLCQTYEQNSVEPSCTASPSSQTALDQMSSISHLTPESILPYGLAGTSEKDTHSRQHRAGFLIIRLPNFEGFEDWDNFR